jgi:hypothetical protein
MVVLLSVVPCDFESFCVHRGTEETDLNIRRKSLKDVVNLVLETTEQTNITKTTKNKM